jgi:nucleoid DNA-binding protein
MIKLDMERAVAEAAGLPLVKAEVAVEELLQAIKDALAAGHRLELRGFGVLAPRPVKRGLARNPRTGQLFPIPRGNRAVRFKPGKDLQAIPYDPPKRP